MDRPWSESIHRSRGGARSSLVCVSEPPVRSLVVHPAFAGRPTADSAPRPAETVAQETVECVNCAFANPAAAETCRQCGFPLHLDRSPSSLTRRVDPPVKLDQVPRWGDALLAGERRLMLYIHGYSQPLLVELKTRLVLGRSSREQPVDVRLDPYGAQTAGVSRQHAALVLEENVIKVIDLNSANGTYLNGHRLYPRQPRILRDGDELRLGNLKCKVGFM